MQTKFTQFSNWLTCQYPHSSARKHTISDLALFFSWAEKPPSAISSNDVDSYIQHCLSKRLSPLTVNRRLSSLRLFYYFLSVINEEPVECPVISKRHFLRKPHPLPHDASEEQIKLLFSFIHEKRDKGMFTLMLECGLRVGEVCNLSLDVVLLDEPPRLKIHGKGGRQRMVYLPPPAYSALNDWLTSRPVTKDRAVFISQRGNASPSPASNLFCKSIVKKLASRLTAISFVTPSAGAWRRRTCRLPRSKACSDIAVRAPHRCTPASQTPPCKPNTTAPSSMRGRICYEPPA